MLAKCGAPAVGGNFPGKHAKPPFSTPPQALHSQREAETPPDSRLHPVLTTRSSAAGAGTLCSAVSGTRGTEACSVWCDVRCRQRRGKAGRSARHATGCTSWNVVSQYALNSKCTTFVPRHLERSVQLRSQIKVYCVLATSFGTYFPNAPSI